MTFDLDVALFIVKIIFIDIILGGDNAVVIAMACRRLPEKQRNKAIFIGTGLAVIVRIILTAMVVSLLKVPFLMLIGAVFLIFIAIRLVTNKEENYQFHPSASLFAAVRTIVFADAVMGLDNMLAIAGAARGHIGYIAVGLVISVPIIVWGSQLILIAMERIPFLIYAGGGILLYTASEMIRDEPFIRQLLADSGFLTQLLPFVLISAVLIVCLVYNTVSSRMH
jgi:integral membrane protein, YjbE family